METVLITGAAGNIGSALTTKLVALGKYVVVAVDNLSTGDRHKLPDQGEFFHFVKADVNNYRDISSVFYYKPVDYVFHFAAVVGVQRTLENPLTVLKDISGIENILNLSKSCAVKRVFYASSSEVYGEPVSLPQHEELTPLNSRLPYAIVKNLGEAYCRSYFSEHGLPYTIFRLFNTYGPNQTTSFVIPRFIRFALNNQPLTIYGDGTQTRTFCFVDDITDAMLGCLEHNFFVNQTLNLGSDTEYSIIDLSKIILKITNSQSPVEHLPALLEGDMTRRRPDISNMKSILKRPLVGIEDGISCLIKHLRKDRR